MLLDKYPAAALAMVQQCIANRHAWQETAAETAALERLTARSDPAALLIRAAYRPLANFTALETAALPAPLAALRREQDDERERAQRFPELTPLAPGLSTAMRAQYESYPYPRWRQISGSGRRPVRSESRSRESPKSDVV